MRDRSGSFILAALLLMSAPAQAFDSPINRGPLADFLNVFREQAIPRQIVYWRHPQYQRGTVVISTKDRRLYYVLGDGRAIEYGVASSVLDDVLAGRRPKGRPEDELIYDICQTMHETHALPRDLYDRAVAAFGERGLMEIMATIGFYTLVSMTLNAFEVQVGPGQTAVFKRNP